MVKCEICGKGFSNNRGLSRHIGMSHKKITKQQYYNLYIKTDPSEGICRQCGKPTDFLSITLGYKKYCGNPCPTGDETYKNLTKAIKDKYGVESTHEIEGVREKSKQTCLKNHGVEYSMQSKEVREKSKQTCLKNHGVESPLQSKKIQEKSKQTMLEKHGVEYPMQSKEIQEKSKQTNMENLGVEYATQSEEIKEKSKQTNLRKRGVEYASQSEEVKKKKKETCLKNHGVENISQLEAIKEKKKETCLKNYGVESPMQSKEIQEKQRNTIRELYNVDNISQLEETQEKIRNTSERKYGVSHFMKSKPIREKIKNTLLKNYGVDSPMKSKEIQERAKQTNMEKRGVEHVFQDKKVQEKIKHTMIENYGVEHALQNKEIYQNYENTMIDRFGVTSPLKNDELKEKQQNTVRELYNVDNISQLEEIKEKKKETCLINHGVEYALQSKEIQEKQQNTIKELYNVDNISQLEEIQQKKKETRIINFTKKIKDHLKEVELELVGEYIHKSEKLKFKCLKCGKTFDIPWLYIQLGKKCPYCYPIIFGSSKQEREVSEFVKSIMPENIEIIENDRATILNENTNRFLELDIYIPEKKIAIEYNGLYWHNDIYKDKNYHLNKYLKCQEKGIKLIQIFEDEWIYKRDIVKSRLKQILKLNDSIMIHGRKCIIQEIDPKIKNEFLNKFHIQGEDKSSIKLGAFYNNELVSVMTFSKGNISKGSIFKEHIYELNRFCSDSNYHIPGIAGKLLSYFKKNYEWKEIFSYADLRWSDGNLYNQLGFELLHVSNPNYWYVLNSTNKRIHRFNLRKRSGEPKDIPEWLLRLKEGYVKVYDCGNLKFQMSKIVI